MTEHVVLRRATDALADLRHREVLALQALAAVRAEVRRVEDFVQMYHRFAGDDIETADAPLPETWEEFIDLVSKPDFERATDPESQPDDSPVASEAGHPSGDTGGQSITEAPTPLPADQGQRAAVSITPVQQPAEAKTSDQEPLSNGSGEVQDECAIHLPTHSPETANDTHPSSEGHEGEEAQKRIPARASGSEDSASPVHRSSGAAAQLPDSVHANPASARQEGRDSAGASVPAAPLLIDRVKAVLTAHPDWTARQVGDELGVPQGRVNDVAKTNGLTIRRLTAEEIHQKRIEGARKGGQVRRSRAPGPVPEIPVKLKDRIIACDKAHPDWDTHQISDAIGEKANSVSAYKSMLGLPIPVRPRAPSKGPRKFVAPPVPVDSTPAVTTSPPSSMPDAAEPEDDGAEFRRRKYGEPERQQVEAPDDDGDAADALPAPRAPRLLPGQKLYLTDGRGNYLGLTCTKLVRPRRGSDGQFKNVWIGNAKQADACRQKFAVARDLRPMAVLKPARPIL